MNLKVHLWRLSRYLLFWLSALAWCGCSTVSAPKVTGSILPDEDRSLIISRVKGCSGAVLSYRALSRAAITTGRHTDKVRQIFVFEKPDKLRIETLPTNAAYSLSLFATRNGVFRFLNTTEKTAVTGRLEKSIFKSVLGLPVGADTLMSLLTGCVSEKFLNDSAALKIYFDRKKDVYYMVKFGLSEYYVLNADDLTLREAQKRKGQKTVFSVLFDSYHIVGNLLIPLNLKIKLPAVNTEVNMLLSSVSLNKNFPSRLYWVEIPKGYSVKHR